MTSTAMTCIKVPPELLERCLHVARQRYRPRSQWTLDQELIAVWGECALAADFGYPKNVLVRWNDWVANPSPDLPDIILYGPTNFMLDVKTHFTYKPSTLIPRRNVLHEGWFYVALQHVNDTEFEVLGYRVGEQWRLAYSEPHDAWRMTPRDLLPIEYLKAAWLSCRTVGFLGGLTTKEK